MPPGVAPSGAAAMKCLGKNRLFEAVQNVLNLYKL
jgi:hypothetical protein